MVQAGEGCSSVLGDIQNLTCLGGQLESLGGRGICPPVPPGLNPGGGDMMEQHGHLVDYNSHTRTP